MTPPDARSAAIAIGGMAAITYAVRAVGLVLAQLLPATPVVTAFLRHLGGSVIVALVAATLAKGDAAGLVATGVTVAIAVSGRPTTAIFAGMAAAALLRWM